MRRWVLLAGGILITAALAWWIARVALLEPGQRSDASSWGQFVLAAVGLLIIVAKPVRQAFSSAQPLATEDLVDLLAAAMRSQWQAAANDRCLLQPAPLPIRWRKTALPVVGPVAGATGNRDGQARFDPLPGLPSVTSAALRNGTRRSLHGVYGGLASGRLMIIGSAGSGKSAAAILLLLDALRFRDQADPAQRYRIPVPVMFTLHGWNPETEPVVDWITGKFTEIPLFRGRDGLQRAARLLEDGRVAVILDGLDEIKEDLRPIALRALSEQATFRLVLLTRSAELVTATRDATLVGAVALELQPITPAAAAEYLLRPLVVPAPPAWQAIADELRSNPASPLSRALDNPLGITLLRDAYTPTQPVDELLDTTKFATPADIEDHLLDHMLAAAYARRPGWPVPRYSAQVATRSLICLAARLDRDGNRDLAWWQLPRLMRSGYLALVSMLIAGGCWGLGTGLVYGWVAGLVIGLLIGVMCSAWATVFEASSTVRIEPMRFVSPRHGWIRRADTSLMTDGHLHAQWVAPIVGTFTGVLVGLLPGILAGVGSYLLTVAVVWLAGSARGDTTWVGPRQQWRQHAAVPLVLGMLAGISSGLTVGIFSGVVPGVLAAVLAALMVSSTITDIFPVVIAQVQLAMSERTPVRLVRFLEDARSRQVLRTVGSIYQFRHAKLQDRLACAARPPRG